jgi:hypothetical protein
MSFLRGLWHRRIALFSPLEGEDGRGRRPRSGGGSSAERAKRLGHKSRATRCCFHGLRWGAALALIVALQAVSGRAAVPGATDTEICIGQTNPYSGPNSAYGANGTAYFKTINDRGGVNGRKIALLSLDDGYSPPRAVEQTRRLVGKAYDIGWHPLQFLPSISSFIGIVLRPAGLDKSRGIVTANFVKDPADPMWRDDPEVGAWNAWMDKYLPNGDKTNMINVNAWIFGAVMVQTLTQCGDDLSRENVLRQAMNLHGFRVPMMLPGITVDTSSEDHRVIKKLQLERFDGTRWVMFGGVLGD